MWDRWVTVLTRRTWLPGQEVTPAMRMEQCIHRQSQVNTPVCDEVTPAKAAKSVRGVGPSPRWIRYIPFRPSILMPGLTQAVLVVSQNPPAWEDGKATMKEMNTH